MTLHEFEFLCPACLFRNTVQIDSKGAGTVTPKDHIEEPDLSVLEDTVKYCIECHKEIYFQRNVITTCRPVIYG